MLELSATQQHVLADLLVSVKNLVPESMSLEAVHSLVMILHKEMEYAVAMVETEESEQEIVLQIEQQNQEQIMAEAEALLRGH